MNRNALNGLLKILKNLDSSLPCDFRKLLQTPRESKLTFISPGSYLHFGLEGHVTKYLEECTIIPIQILIDLNIDAVPILKDSYKSP